MIKLLTFALSIVFFINTHIQLTEQRGYCAFGGEILILVIPVVLIHIINVLSSSDE